MKLNFEIKNIYEIDVDEDDYCEMVDYVSYNAYDLVENGDAKLVEKSIVSVYGC